MRLTLNAEEKTMRWRRVLICSVLITGMGFAATVGLARPAFAAVLECSSGDVACLIAAINTANANGEVNTIHLAAGTYTLAAADNDADGPNGLPSITSALTIVGDGAANTIVERETNAPPFRLLHIGQAGLLRLEGLTVRGGFTRSNLQGPAFPGGGLHNRGTVLISQSTVAGNISSGASGGGIFSSGRLVIVKSIIANNFATQGFGGGLWSLPGATIVNSTISGNIAPSGGGVSTGGFSTDGSVTVIGSTIADNFANEGNGGGLLSFSGSVVIINSTIARNRNRNGMGSGIAVGTGIVTNSTIALNRGGPALTASSALALQNTILARNAPGAIDPDCAGAVTSLDNNFFGDPRCATTLLPQDQTGDPGLGDFTDDGTPGGGYVPLVAGSAAIDAGNDGACLPTDQRGQPRVGRCDIGAIEFTE
jgi:hypothetical protein